jgi:hypothetical protein
MTHSEDDKISEKIAESGQTTAACYSHDQPPKAEAR